MRIYLDDERTTPEGFIRTYTPAETIKLIEDNWNDVSIVSLDHDLGDDEGIGTGYDVVVWVEKQVAFNNLVPPYIKVHSANPAARERMEAGIESIYRLYRKRVHDEF